MESGVPPARPGPSRGWFRAGTGPGYLVGMWTKRLIIGTLIIVPLAWLVWICLYPDDWRLWLGFSSQATYNYAFVSGVGPMFLTALGFGTIITGLWHAHNCHTYGCWNIGKHRVKGSPYCSYHYPEALGQKDTNDLLQEILDYLKNQAGDSGAGGGSS